jgi:hypothetical protein
MYSLSDHDRSVFGKIVISKQMIYVIKVLQYLPVREEVAGKSPERSVGNLNRKKCPIFIFWDLVQIERGYG